MSLSFQEFGRGPAILLMHGLFGSGDNLRVIARGLEDRFRVILPDLPNHGSSPHLSGSTHLAMAEAVEEFIDQQGISGPVVGGHSIGGKIAMLMALRDPNRYAAVISVDMAPRPYEASHLGIIEGMKAIPLDKVSSRRDADAALEGAVPDPGVRSFLLKNLVREDGIFRWQLNLDAISADYASMLGWQPPAKEYGRPALFVGGQRSRYLQADRDRDIIARWFPAAEIHMIPDAGHWLHADKPAELLRIMDAFLSGIGLS